MQEAVHVASGQGPLPDAAWQRLLLAHFHDAIPGSSIQEVYAEMNPELEAIGNRATAAALRALEAESNESGVTALAFNSLPFDRLATVGHGTAAVQVQLPALGSVPTDGNRQVTDPILEASESVLRHARLAAHFDENGQLAELIVDERPLEFDGSPSFVLSPDNPVAFDAWDIDHHAARVGQRVAEPMQLRLVEHSPVRAVLESEPVALGVSSTMHVRYVLEAGSTHLIVEPVVQWQESHQLLRYVVPTRYRGRRAWFGCPFGAIERPQLSGTEADEAMWEVPGSRWAAVQHEGGTSGLAIVAESKLGYAARDGTLSVSLLRASKWPDATADLGMHTMPLALGALHLETTEDHLSTSMAADALFSTPLLYEGAPRPALFQWHCLGSLNASWSAPSVAAEGGTLSDSTRPRVDPGLPGCSWPTQPPAPNWSTSKSRP